ncbi:hypothetical protein SODALDRAFT_327059 [Sodiomyces alkalinus F11]|uniref:Mitochondrial fission process protein 1 n=1 Tax=Sodiomyces alkalinus (strain CBS 110278 / VKM F-3762 / F11) TaxID=1314773 RepID=A0A3N2Q7Z4_SODAK|nr:hypothetical protein SODALDRAFT_327059 [Sodiomyces alkalinus F11]ROT42899.1 hypothetical protein SODALDRAFT_327059 [Sodiomyces alkalinus F11]
MWWKKFNVKEPATTDDTAQERPRSGASHAEDDKKTFDLNKASKSEKLPASLQKIVDGQDKEDNFYNELVDGYVPESTESNVRYAAYATRVRTILMSAHRYVAYTSDIGESFRPVAHPNLVRTAYGISWLYILGDVSHEGYKAYWHNQRILNPSLQLTEHQEKFVSQQPVESTEALQIQPGKVSPLEDYRTVMVQRGIFQTLASMGLPAFTIHSTVKYSGKAMKNVKNARLRAWGPIGLGLAVVPVLPFLFDQPVEDAVEWLFYKGFEAYGGKGYVENAPTTRREDLLSKKGGTENEL